ncbi:hypothetical protein COY26_01720 [Candidatus Woesearchaeota archaeon CG_4_10_14_0_2_um_filter_33_10]|nr:MAG: hypothetical protein AUJ83_01855 [Candidatus Woesearchaeota archaeon CG1_02_33_12]PIN77491.1 MAG: hypothetical protein COV14_05830 [Candidatus Woesearchaeota archaeon CG10_big_fil_rev_8_21_14_0_10_33_12]PIU72044.1 MAG: hypothetical protein COS79_04975 [Candidatus Woesearchaeota archaeon CG06_land_8_20_14_3_00_33_13]PIZ53492.1 MAG: hypothetical protein COY26_01720 [Candidatus Woesearchaeota archaeon CG_4_10_14_0_2_um_filter_33_10]
MVKIKKGILAILYKEENKKVLYALFKRKEGWIGYEFLKGGKEANETDEQALFREVKEEASLSITSAIKSKYTYSFESKKNDEIVRHKLVVFYVKLSKGEIIIGPEHSEFGFYDYETALKLLPFKTLKELFKKINAEFLK